MIPGIIFTHNMSARDELNDALNSLLQHCRWALEGIYALVSSLIWLRAFALRVWSTRYQHMFRVCILRLVQLFDDHLFCPYGCLLAPFRASYYNFKDECWDSFVGISGTFILPKYPPLCCRWSWSYCAPDPGTLTFKHFPLLELCEDQRRVIHKKMDSWLQVPHGDRWVRHHRSTWQNISQGSFFLGT